MRQINPYWLGRHDQAHDQHDQAPADLELWSRLPEARRAQLELAAYGRMFPPPAGERQRHGPPKRAPKKKGTRT